MIGPANTGLVLLLSLLCRPPCEDVVTLKNGREIEGLVVETDDEQLTVLRAAEGTLQSWRLIRTEIAEIQLSTPDVVGFRAVARRLESDRRPEEASHAWRRVCMLRPESVPDRIRLIQCCRQLGQLDAAAAVARSAAKAQPTDPRFPLEQGEIALAQGRGSEAVTFAREHLRLAGASSAEGTWLLARGLEVDTQPEEALAAYLELLRNQPRRGDALDRLTEIALGQDKADVALREAEKMTRAAPDLRAGWIAIGKIRYRQDRFGEAVTAFQSATHLGGPDYERARIFLQCALGRRYNRDPRVLLSPGDLETAGQLDPELRRKP
jgi:tetratricopeptide (TPR) repeat protein